MTQGNWYRQFPEHVGGGIDCWIGDSPLGNQWLVTMWFGDEDSGGELKPDEFAIELSKMNHETHQWEALTYDELSSRQEVLETFEQMKATCD